jgi:acetyl-CoA synthetase
LILHPSCSESAVVAVPDDLTGQAIVCFCTLKGLESDEASLIKSLVMEVRSQIGPFATPKKIILVPDLPKTRSGKIMRRILRKLASGEVSLQDTKNEQVLMEKLGDLSTLADPQVIHALIQKIF